jgi:hypothetical protein
MIWGMQLWWKLFTSARGHRPSKALPRRHPSSGSVLGGFRADPFAVCRRQKCHLKARNPMFFPLLIHSFSSVLKPRWAENFLLEITSGLLPFISLLVLKAQKSFFWQAEPLVAYTGDRPLCRGLFPWGAYWTQNLYAAENNHPRYFSSLPCEWEGLV